MFQWERRGLVSTYRLLKFYCVECELAGLWRQEIITCYPALVFAYVNGGDQKDVTATSGSRFETSRMRSINASRYTITFDKRSKGQYERNGRYCVLLFTRFFSLKLQNESDFGKLPLPQLSTVP
jgi:hypothetical protein